MQNSHSVLFEGKGALWLALVLGVCGWLSPAGASAALDRELATVAGARGSDVFLIDSDQTIQHYWRKGDGARWSGFEQLDGLARDIAAIDLGNGRFEVFVVGTDGDLWSNRQLDRGLWSGFRALHFPSKQVAIARTPEGRFELFVIGTDDGVWRSVRNGPDGEWSSFQGLGGVATQLSAASTSDESVRVYVVGSDRAVWTSDSQDVAWLSLGGNISDVSVGRAADGGLLLYAIGERRSIWQRRALDAGMQFGAWERLAGSAKRISASGSGDAQRLFALDGSLSEFDAQAARWRKLAHDGLPLEATFVGLATMKIPSLDVTQHRHVRIGVRFSADRRRVQVTSFPAFTTQAFQTPFGKNQTTVSLKSGGNGSYDPETGKLELHVTLHFDQSLNVPFIDEDADVVLTLSTDGEHGKAVASKDDATSLRLAASSRFVTNGGLNPLNRKACQVTLSGGFPFPTRLLTRGE